jgi:hypothetical protein
MSDPSTWSFSLVDPKRYSYSEAERPRAIQQDPNLAKLSEFGNVYLGKPLLPSLRINRQRFKPPAYLYRAYSQETFLSGKTDKAFQRARQLAPELVDYYTDIDTPNRPSNLNRLVIDEVITPGRLWNRFLDNFMERKGSVPAVQGVV